VSNALATVAQLREAQQRIAWIDSHAGFSDWLKIALKSAVERNPVDVINDLEILTQVLRAWTTAAIQMSSLSTEARLGDGAENGPRIID